MKRLFGAGLIALLCHGALLLINGKSPGEKPELPLSTGICVALTAAPQERQPVQQPLQKNEEKKITPTKQQNKPVLAPQKTKEPLLPQKVEKKLEETANTPEKENKKSELKPAAETGIETSPVAREPSPPPTYQRSGLAKTKALPLYEKNPPPRYPPLARRWGVEGTVGLDVLVNRAGKVTTIHLAASSGHAILDKEAMQAVQKWLFKPGKQGNEHVEMWVRVPVCFRLHD